MSCPLVRGLDSVTCATFILRGVVEDINKTRRRQGDSVGVRWCVLSGKSRADSLASEFAHVAEESITSCLRRIWQT